MKAKFKYGAMMFAGLALAAMVLSGCMAAMTTQAAPTAARPAGGEKPTAAMIPIGSSNQPETAAFVTEHLTECLQDRNVFQFVDQEKVNRAVAAGGYDLSRIYGLSAAEYKALGDTLGADYLIHGLVGVQKKLKFTGWRQDVEVYMKLYDGTTGATVDRWRSITDFAFTDAGTEKDAREMARSAANHVCGKIIESGF